MLATLLFATAFSVSATVSAFVAFASCVVGTLLIFEVTLAFGFPPSFVTPNVVSVLTAGPSATAFDFALLYSSCASESLFSD